MLPWLVVSVVHVLSSLGLGGQEMLVQRLATRQQARGWRVEVVSMETAPADDGLVARLAALPVHTLPKREGFDRETSVAMTHRFRALRPDIVHTHNPLPLIYAAVPARLAGARVVHTKHGQNPARGGNLWARRAAALAVDAFVAVSPQTAAQAVASRECARAKLSTIVNGIDTAVFAPDAAFRQQHRAAWGAGDQTCVMISVGRLDENKHHALLLAAVGQLPAADRARVIVVLVGEGAQRPALQAQAQTLGLGAQVRFLGKRTDAHALLAAADLFALTSRSEGMPLAAAEAMACGLPVVGTDVGGMRDLVDACGVLVPNGEVAPLTSALASLIDNAVLRRHLGAQARARVTELFSLAAMDEAYAAIYQQVLRRRA